MIQAIQKIERSIKERRDVDVPFMNWWLYIFIVHPVTLGIYGIILFIKRTRRVDKFIVRKRDYYQSVLDYTERYCQDKNVYDNIRNDLNDLKEFVNGNFSKNIKEIKAGISSLLIIITLGIWGFIWLYKMNIIWYKLQKLEQDFDDKLSQIWTKVGLIKYPLTFNLDSSKKRSYALYLILSIITFSIWGLVWDYKIHTDPENLYKEFHSTEDTVLQTVRQ
ncbi:MAG: DUF4234 domain-containing protein [Spirochaetota bacterium]|nr:DUF4234 domain-containing protein [Spirochaetota bacterium]